MTLANLLAERVVIEHRTAGAANRYGVPVDTVTSTTTDVPARLEQTDSLEVEVGETTVVSTWRIYLPADQTIGPRDRVINSAGVEFEVVGVPDVKSTPRGPHHIEARLRFVE